MVQSNEQLISNINELCPAMQSSKSISHKALRLALSADTDCVLIGLRQPKYLDDILDIDVLIDSTAVKTLFNNQQYKELVKKITEQ